MEYIKLDELKECLTEKGFTILGHGTGYKNTEAIASIFKNGLRASHTSIFYTTIGLDVDESLVKFKDKLDHWQHHDSENIILIKLPNEYFNMIGDSSDLECERTSAFVNKKTNDNNSITYYLDPRFIIGAYNRNSSSVILNPNYEKILSKDTKEKMQRKLENAISKVKERNKKFDEQLLGVAPETIDNNPSIDSTLDNFEWDAIDWNDEFFQEVEKQSKSR